MRLAGVTLILVLGSLSVIAWYLKPRTENGGKTPLLWTTANFPSRQEQVRIFNELNPDLNLILDYTNRNARKTIVQSTSGMGPDIIDVQGGRKLQLFARTGILMDLSYYHDKYGFHSAIEDWPYLERELYCDGIQYGYPLSLQVDIVIYNKNVFDHFGVAYPVAPVTWTDFIELAQRVTRITDNPETSVYGVVNPTWDKIFYSLKGEFFTDEGRRLLINSPKMQQAFQWVKDCHFKYKVTPSNIGIYSVQGGSDTTPAGILLAEGHFAMILRPKETLIQVEMALENQKKRLSHWKSDPNRREKDRPELVRLGAMLMPHFEGMPPAYFVRARCLAVNSRSPRKYEAFRFIQFIRSAEYSRIVNQTHDFIPPIPAYVDLGVPEGPKELSVREIHNINVEALNYAHQTRSSPFLMDLEIDRLLNDQVSRMLSNPNLEVEDLLDEAQRELEEIMSRNIERRPELQRLITASTDYVP